MKSTHFMTEWKLKGILEVVLEVITVRWKIIQTKIKFFGITCTKRPERSIKNVMFWFDVDFKIIYLVLESCSCKFASVCFLNLIYNLVIHNHTMYTIRPLYVVMNIEKWWDWFIHSYTRSQSKSFMCFLFHFARCDTQCKHSRPNVAGGIWKWSLSKSVSTLIYTSVNIWTELPQRDNSGDSGGLCVKSSRRTVEEQQRAFKWMFVQIT